MSLGACRSHISVSVSAGTVKTLVAIPVSTRRLANLATTVPNWPPGSSWKVTSPGSLDTAAWMFTSRARALVNTSNQPGDGSTLMPRQPRS